MVISKNFIKMYVSTIIIMGIMVSVCLYFGIYDKGFQFVLPKRLTDLLLNNLGVFGNVIFWGTFSFSFIGLLLTLINMIVLSSNIAGMIAAYGINAIGVLFSYGFLELMMFPISFCIFLDLFAIYKDLYKNRHFDKSMLLFLKRQCQKIVNWIVLGVILIVIAGILEMTLGKWLFDLIL